MKYAASLDKTSKIITLFVSLLFIVIISLNIWYAHDNALVSLLVTVMLLLIYAITYCYRPVNYQIKNNNIVVHRYASNVVFSRNEIKSVQLVTPQKLQGAIRIFGVGGLFGYFGKYINRDLGYMTWYATQRDNEAVLIELNNQKKIIITPDKPEQFVDELSQIA